MWQTAFWGKAFGELREQRARPRRSARALSKAIMESLEPRLMLTAVTNDNDSGAGSLRAAILAANSSGSDQTITIDPSLTGTTITLSNGSLEINDPGFLVTIVGPTGGITIDQSGAHMVFGVESSAELENLTITGGHGTGGEGIQMGNDLTLVNCTVTGNTNTGQNGGGIQDFFGYLTMQNSTITGNSAPSGGGIYDWGGGAYISYSTVSGNTGSKGGGIYLKSAGGTISNSTISGNTATNNGGGIFSTSTYLQIVNSTISGNTSAAKGGGIYNSTHSHEYIADSTIATNSAATAGAGIAAGTGSFRTTLDATIIAGNVVGNAEQDLSGSTLSFTGTLNLVGDGTGSTHGLSSANNPLLNHAADLAPLGWYGGPTQTMALLPQSPAIGAGSSFSVNGNSIAADQRGFTRPSGSSPAPDIGAFQTQGSDSIIDVNTNQDDITGGGVAAGSMSLRDAITLADALGGNQTITFDPSLTESGAATITLDSDLPVITDSTGTITFEGPGSSSLTVTGQQDVGSPFVVEGGTVIFDGLRFADFTGIAIQAYEPTIQTNVIVNDCVITGDTSVGVLNSYGSMTIVDSTISGNTGAHGGGVYTYDGGLTISDSTISGNTATQAGGGIYDSFSNLYITNSTIADNTADSGGGAYVVYGESNSVRKIVDSTIAGNVGGGITSSYGAQTTLDGTIVANNTSSGGHDLSGTGFSGSYNLISDGSGGLTNPSNIQGTTADPIDPRLAPLANNGGPTQTMALLVGSPAITNPGFSDTAITTDQRGDPRPTNANSNIGAYQIQDAPFFVGNLDGSGSISSGFTGSVFVPTGTSITANRVREANLDVAGDLTIAPGIGIDDASHESYLNGLTIAQNRDGSFAGTLDLNNNELIISTSSADAQQALFGTLLQALSSGYNNGAWNGTGIITTADRGNPKMGLGLFTSNVGSDYEVIITDDLVGDVNNDQAVNGVDLGVVSVNINHAVTLGWEQGDFDYDGVVNGVDLGLLNANINKGLPPPPASDNAFAPRFVATFSDPDNQPASDFTAIINWGDGTPQTSGAIVALGNGVYNIVGDHTYPVGGTYMPTVIVTDSDGQNYTANGSVHAIAVPQLTFTGANTSLAGATYSIGLSAQFAASDSPDTVSYWLINVPSQTVIQTASTPVNTTLDYNNGNPTVISVQAVDSYGYTYQLYSPPITVSLAPPVLTVSGATSVLVGSSYNYTFGASIPAADLGVGVQSETVTWGDGHTDPITSRTLPHAYQTAGGHTLQFSVTLNTGAIVTSTGTINAIVPPIALGQWVKMDQPPGYVMLLLTDGNVMSQNYNDPNATEWEQLPVNSSGTLAGQLWSAASDSNMQLSRQYFASLVLPSGQIFVAGGEYSSGGNDQDDYQRNAAEIYTPSTNSWGVIDYPVPTALEETYRYPAIGDSECKLLPDGRILVATVLFNGAVVQHTLIFDPSQENSANGPWSIGPSALGSQSESSWVTLPDGSILTVDNNIFPASFPNQSGTNTAERYVPSSTAGSGTWIATAPSGESGALNVQLFDNHAEIGPAVMLDNGKAIFFGATGHTAIFTPDSTSPYGGSWSAGPDLPKEVIGNQLVASDSSAAVLPDGNVLVEFGDGPTYSLFEYYPNLGSGGSFAALPDAPSLDGGGDGMLVLPDGGVLLSNGWEFKPDDAPYSAAVPAIDAILSNGAGSFTLTGTGLNGLDGGAAEGDDIQMDTNYPLVRLTSSDGTYVYYATTSDWTLPGQVATGPRVETVNFTLPAGLPSGAYSLQVVTNGLASNAVTFVQESAGSHGLVLQISPTNSAQDQLLENNSPIYTAPTATMPELILNLQGSDTFTIDGSNGDPAPSGGITINGGATTVDLAAGAVAVLSPNVAALSITSGTVDLPAQYQNGGLQNFQAVNLNIAVGASLVMLSPANWSDRTILNLTSLSLASGGTLDVGGNELLINYGSGPDPIASIRGEILTGYNGGLWNGTGITSSKAAAVDSNPANYQSGLGIGDSADPDNSAGLPPGQLEVVFTLYGDADLSGTVNGVDYGILAANVGKGTTGWDAGDFNYDGSIDNTDYQLLMANYGQSAT
jgi:hypothetical protein